MDDSDILQYLLEVEGQASALVSDAQAEAAKRVKSAEEQNRSVHDQQYHALIQELEADYQKELAAVKAGYDQSLAEYSHSLDAMPLNTGAFAALVSSLLFGEK
ncbi:MAG: hypothetical protein LBP60_07830 [Spirochaetaceae bacterium]|jgi:vacuolar-type H+-ATPase subunit H|nr:hypothetical protein [Spirochaetaceae bacterium]